MRNIIILLTLIVAQASAKKPSALRGSTSATITCFSRRVKSSGVKAEGRFLTALRKAEESCAEAKTFQENKFMARTLSTIGQILFNMKKL